MSWFSSVATLRCLNNFGITLAPPSVIAIYLVATNVVTFFIYGIDKWKAKHAKWRISEVALLVLAMLGGSVGAWMGMKAWHHKTMHKKFKYGIPLILFAQIAFFLYFYRWLSRLCP